MSFTRRRFLTRAGAATAALRVPLSVQLPPIRPSAAAPGATASDEDYWRQVASHYRISEAVINPEAG